jgi:hypothetical protein
VTRFTPGHGGDRASRPVALDDEDRPASGRPRRGGFSATRRRVKESTRLPAQPGGGEGAGGRRRLLAEAVTPSRKLSLGGRLHPVPAASSAWSRSAMMSSICSMPMERRT